MSIEDFKHQFVHELVGLTTARVTTLWKKSKTMSRDEILDAITQSKTARSRDQQRRLNVVEITDQTHSKQPIEQLVPEPEPEPEPVPEHVDTRPILHSGKKPGVLDH